VVGVSASAAIATMTIKILFITSYVLEFYPHITSAVAKFKAQTWRFLRVC
jgi:hypothetical protein